MIAVRVCKAARVDVVAGPTPGADTEGGKLEHGGGKVPVSGGRGHLDAGSAEADDVGHAVAAKVRKLARVGIVAAPAASAGTEGGKLERGRGKVPASCGQGHVDTGLAEADDVGHAVAVDVCKLARVGVVVAPTAGVGAEGGELEGGRSKVSAGGGERLVHTGRAEADDVGSPVPVYVRQLARVGVVAAPTAGVGTEGGKLERGRREVRRSGGGRLVDGRPADIDDVVSGVPADVRHV